jgi:ribosome-associated protein
MKKTNLNKVILESLEDSKALNIVTLDVKKLTNMCDHMIICTGTSTRHVAGVGSNLAEAVKAAGFPVLRMEGEETAEWVLINLGDTLVHVMQASTRQLYELEKLWSKPNTEGDMPKWD